MNKYNITKNRSIYWIIILSFCILILGNFLFFTNNSKGVRFSIFTPTDIPWQTYRNEKYGFEFQYPSKWDTDFDSHFSLENPTYSSNFASVVKSKLFFKDRNIKPDDKLIGQEVVSYSFYTGSVSHKMIGLSISPKTNIIITLSDDVTSNTFQDLDKIFSTIKFIN